MTRLIGGVGKDGNFVIGKVEPTHRHSGFKEESASIQRVTHNAELQQPFNPDGTPNIGYTTIYRERAIEQGIIEGDAELDFQRFE